MKNGCHGSTLGSVTVKSVSRFPVVTVGFEPTTSPSIGGASGLRYVTPRSRQGSNLRPPVFHTGALPAELQNHAAPGGAVATVTGIEPVTLGLTSRCSTTELHSHGGGGTRTRDIRRMRPAFYQLNYPGVRPREGPGEGGGTRTHLTEVNGFTDRPGSPTPAHQRGSDDGILTRVPGFAGRCLDTRPHHQCPREGSNLGPFD